MLLLLACILCFALVVACAETGMDGADDTEEQPGIALPADGLCRSGVVIQKGESCTHTYSYSAGVTFSSSGSTEIFETEEIEFRVDDDGIGHYGDRLSGTSLESTVNLGDDKIVFIARGRDDGSFFIEEATQRELDDFLDPDLVGLPCLEGLELEPGERCRLQGGGEFTVETDGDGCFGGSLCSGRSLSIQGFVAERLEDGSWLIVSTP